MPDMFRIVAIFSVLLPTFAVSASAGLIIGCDTVKPDVSACESVSHSSPIHGSVVACSSDSLSSLSEGAFTQGNSPVFTACFSGVVDAPLSGRLATVDWMLSHPPNGFPLYRPS